MDQSRGKVIHSNRDDKRIHQNIINFAKEKMKEPHDRQNNYADKRRKELEFQRGEMFYLKRVTFKENDRAVKMGKM